MTKPSKGSKARRLKNLKQNNQTVAGEGSSNAHNKYYVNSDTDSDAILYSLCLDTSEESDNETNDVDDSNMDLSDDNPDRDYDAAGFGVFMYNKSIKTPNSTYLNPTVTSSSLDFIQNLLNKTHANELMDFVSNLVYTVSQSISTVIYPEGNPELTSYISDSKIDFFKAEISTRTKGNVYSDLKIKLVVRIMVNKKWGYDFITTIVVRRSDDKEYEFIYADLPRLTLNDVEDMYFLLV
nr:hypothetical protein [Tanacetum cinerariifolium]